MKKCFYIAGLLMLNILFGSLRVFATAGITVQPVNRAGCSGSSVQFVIGTSPMAPTYIWYVSADAGSTWTMLTDGGLYSGSATDTLSVTTTGSLNGYYFHCQAIFGTDTLTSDAAGLTVDTGYVSPIMGSSSICIGGTATLSCSTAGGVWSSANTAIETISSSGVVSGVTQGMDSIFYSITNSCGTNSSVRIETTDSGYVSSITGASTVCAGSHITLSDASTGGMWSVVAGGTDSIGAMSGVLYGVSQGSDTVKYTLMNACGTYVAWAMASVDTLPAAIMGIDSFCAGSSVTVSESVTGGTWSVMNASIDTVTSSGLLTGIAAGMDTVVYTLTNGCGTNTAKFNDYVLGIPTASPITGGNSLCAGSQLTLTEGATGGVWSDQNNMIDTVSSMGVVYGISVGTDTIKYTITNMCGSASVSNYIRVDTMPAAIMGGNQVCVGSSITLTDAIPGGIWKRKTAAFDSISATGVLHGIATGSDSVYYILTNACGTDTAKIAISVITTPVVNSILGSSTVCVGGAALALSDATLSGVWSNRHHTLDSVGATSGRVTGMSAGLDTIVYSVTNICGTGRATKPVTVSAAAYAGTITGPSALCVGSSTVLELSVTGGTWNHTNKTLDTIETIHSAPAFEEVIARAAGTDTLTYIVSNSCGSDTLWYVMRLDTNNTAGTVVGNNNVCGGGGTDTLMDATMGGTWSSAHTTIATVSASGIVSGVGSGIDSIMYTITNSCGSRVAALVITVNPAPNSGVIYGPSHICLGSSAVLHDTLGMSGGVWSLSNGTLASLTEYIADSVKISTTAAGFDTLSYAVTNSCGFSIVKYAITIDTTVHPVAITGTKHVCIGSTVNLSSTPMGGSWVSKSPMLASVNSTGMLTGVAAGTDTVYYAYTNGCGSDTVMTTDTVLSLPNVGVISGAASVCLGDSAMLSESVGGGTWSLSSSLYGTISTTGQFNSSFPGRDTVYYTVVGTRCTGKAWRAEYVDTMPVIQPIMGPSTVCVGGFINLTDNNTWGSFNWIATNANATITPTGIVTGVMGGMDTIVYEFTNACGADTVMTTVNVQTPPVNGSLHGPSYVCLGSQITLNDSIGGGIWISGNPTIGSIDASMSDTAFITGRHVGTALISYTYWNSCGAAVDTETISVYGVALPIAGLDSVGVGFYTQLTDPTPGGTWSSSNNLFATVNASGLVKGVSHGTGTGTVDTVIITYTVNTPCGNSSASMPVVVGAPPVAGTIVAPEDTVCVGLNINLYNISSTLNAVPHWSSKWGNASVDQYGVVTGIAGQGLDSMTYVALSIRDTGKIAFDSLRLGTDSIIYTVTNGFGVGRTGRRIHVNSVPVLKVSHYLITYGGSPAPTYTMLDTPAGGTWTSLDPASIVFHVNEAGDPVMVVLGPSTDTISYNDTLIYTYANKCGIVYDTLIYNLPAQNAVKNVNANAVSLHILPNPSNGTFNIVYGSDLDETITIVINNMVGEKVDEFTIKSNTDNLINLNQADGVYILTATGSSSKSSAKIVVAR